MPPHRDKTFLDILLDNNAMKTHRHGQWLIMLIYIKSVGVYSCHSFHAERPSHCPILLNEQRQKPTPICIRKNHLYPKGYKVTMHNTHPWTSTVASFLTEFGKLRSFSASRTKRQVNAFYMSCPHPFPNRHQSLLPDIWMTRNVMTTMVSAWKRYKIIKFI